MFLIDTVTDLKSSVPTVVDARSGVNTMWFLGEMTVRWYLLMSKSCASLAEAQPVPRMTSPKKEDC